MAKKCGAHNKWEKSFQVPGVREKVGGLIMEKLNRTVIDIEY